MSDLEQKNIALEQELAEYKAKFDKMMKERQESAKLLVRRDLALSHANEQLQSLDIAKSEFISIAAHQLRTPLSAIKWIMHMLSHDEFKDANERKDFIEKAADSTDRMIELVNDLLEVDHIQSGKYQFVFKPVDVGELIKVIAGELQTLANERKVTIVLDLAQGGIVNGDALRLRALIQNLMDNALKYTPAGGTITVTSRVDGDQLNLSVADSGIGIPEAQKNSIFKKFFRASNAIRIDTVGSGLGLFIAKEITERHGGKIRFESESDKGTTFFVSLPKG